MEDMAPFSGLCHAQARVQTPQAPLLLCGKVLLCVACTLALGAYTQAAGMCFLCLHLRLLLILRTCCHLDRKVAVILAWPERIQQQWASAV